MGTLSTVAIVAAGIFIIYLGYLIRVKKMLSLIIGFSDSTFYGDRNKYAKRTGTTAIILGAAILITPLLSLLFGKDVVQIYKYLIGIYVVIMLIIANYWRFRF